MEHLLHRLCIARQDLHHAMTMCTWHRTYHPNQWQLCSRKMPGVGPITWLHGCCMAAEEAAGRTPEALRGSWTGRLMSAVVAQCRPFRICYSNAISSSIPIPASMPPETCHPSTHLSPFTAAGQVVTCFEESFIISTAVVGISHLLMLPHNLSALLPLVPTTQSTGGITFAISWMTQPMLEVLA